MFDSIKNWWNSRKEAELEQVRNEVRMDMLEKFNTQMASPKSQTDDVDTMFNWENYIETKLDRNASDKRKYLDYDLMDEEVPEMSAALDANADFVVYPSDTSKTEIFKVAHPRSSVQKKIDDITNRTNMQQEAFTMVRNTLKYGDNFEELIVNKDRNRVLGFRHISVKTMVPNVENGNLKSPAYLQVNDVGKTIAELTEDEVFHLCLALDRNKYVKYRKGTSMLQFARLSYRQLRLMEEGLMITRLSRANQHYAIVVDVGNYEGDEALDYVDKYKKKIFRRKYIDQRTGQWSWEYNPLSVIEDIVVPTRQGSGANVIPLNNANMAGKNIEDINYFQNKMIFATNTPKVIIGKETDLNSKSTAETQMTGFLRKIRRFQSILEPQIKQFYISALALEGVIVKPEDLKMTWPISNFIDEERRWRIEKLKLDCGSMWAELGLADDLFIYTVILGMTEEEALALQKRLDDIEAKHQDEIDDLLINADDESDKSPDDFENGTDTDADDKKKPVKAKKKAEKESDEDDREATKEELLGFMQKKLGEAKFKKWMKIQDTLDKNPDMKQIVIELIELTQAKLFA